MLLFTESMSYTINNPRKDYLKSYHMRLINLWYVSMLRNIICAEEILDIPIFLGYSSRITKDFGFGKANQLAFCVLKLKDKKAISSTFYCRLS